MFMILHKPVSKRHDITSPFNGRITTGPESEPVPVHHTI